MKQVLILMSAVFILAACDSTEQNVETAVEPVEVQTSVTEESKGPDLASGATEAVAPSGSGWDEVDGSIVNYEYDGFGGFYLHFRDNKIKWKGFSGGFTGVVNLIVPQVSKVAEDIYFLSWKTQGNSGDNVVVNFQDMSVFAHLGGASSFNLISGVVHCRNTPDCIAPEGEVMEGPQIMQTLMKNAQDAGFSNPMEAMAGGGMGPADEQGMAELTGKTFAYETPEGQVKVSVNGEETTTSIGDAEPVTSPTYATYIAEGIYYVSWDGEPSGNHVVFNSHNMRVYDQILADGTRAEAIYTATCFSAEGC